MGSVSEFIDGIATGSSAVNTDSDVVDGGTDLFAEVLGFFTDLLGNLGS